MEVEIGGGEPTGTISSAQKAGRGDKATRDKVQSDGG